MKNLFPFLLLLGLSFVVHAQPLPVQSATIFKNGQSILHKSGKVSVSGARHSMTELPEALFSTYWATGAELSSVFAVLDSVETTDPLVNMSDLLRKNLGKQLIVYLAAAPAGISDAPLQGVGEQIIRLHNGAEYLVVRTKEGAMSMVALHDIRRFDFLDRPDLKTSGKKAQKRLDLIFRTNKNEQEVGLSYLVNKIGWTPIYRLELMDKNRGRLSLQAEIVNDAESLGEAELRLAVGIPNFMYASQLSRLVTFDEHFRPVNPLGRGGSGGGFAQMSNSYQVSYPIEYRDFEMPPASDMVDGAQAEDFYFYTVRPGNFPKNSRYQHPIFETDVEPTHFYESVLPTSTTRRSYAYQEKSSIEEKIPVSHFVEFKNTTRYPWTTGAANLLSQGATGMQPLSQDMLPYTAPGGTCKVKIAQTPEIKITHGEGDVDRQANAKKFFSTTYDKVKIEAKVFVVNYKKEPVTLKICRTIEGAPLVSEQKWTTKQEQATLMVNPSNTLEWNIELKPGEERKWTYSYEVFVNM